MSPAENSFRTAFFGGFNRQDVLNYIEQSAKSANERIESLQKEADAAGQARSAAEAALRQSKEREAALSKETEQVSKALAERTSALAALQAELARERAAHTAVREELGALKDQTAKLAQGASAYADLKDRTATIELEAHQRARNIEKEAMEKAKKVRTAAEQILYKVQAGYGRLRSDVDATITHASGELGRVDKALESVKAEFAEHDAELERLLRSYRESTGHKPPEPLPLAEK